jgi:upstream activation factor subunit UAF30
MRNSSEVISQLMGGTVMPTTKKTANKPAAKKIAAKTPVRKQAKTPKKESSRKRQPNAAFTKPLQPSPALASIIGDKPMPRTEVTKKIWDYIKSQGLQDAANKRMINADEKLREVFGGKKQVSMFEMTKLVNAHLQ